MNELAVIENNAPALIRPIAKPQEIIAAHKEAVEMIQQTLDKGTDFGPMPGAPKAREGEAEKMVLFKPGAERLNAAYGFCPVFEILEEDVDHSAENPYRMTKWVDGVKPANRDEENRLKAAGLGRNRKYGSNWKWQEPEIEEGVSIGLYRYVIRCTLNRGDYAVGQGVGSCSSLESKYIRQPRDSENTILKIAKKRAFVDAILTTLGLSDRFTQDVEDIEANKRAREGATDAEFTDEPEANGRATPRNERQWPAGTTRGQMATAMLQERGVLAVGNNGKLGPAPAHAEALKAFYAQCKDSETDPNEAILNGLNEGCESLDDLTHYAQGLKKPEVVTAKVVDDEAKAPATTKAESYPGEADEAAAQEAEATLPSVEELFAANPTTDALNAEIEALDTDDLVAEVMVGIGANGFPDPNKPKELKVLVEALKPTFPDLVCDIRAVERPHYAQIYLWLADAQANRPLPKPIREFITPKESK